METLSKACAPTKAPGGIQEASVCSRCGQKFKSSYERIELDDQRCICSACYNRLAFPEVIRRCPE
jgi:hypothetical protein